MNAGARLAHAAGGAIDAQRILLSAIPRRGVLSSGEGKISEFHP
jgi:hypothetical protein